MKLVTGTSLIAVLFLLGCGDPLALDDPESATLESRAGSPDDHLAMVRLMKEAIGREPGRLGLDRAEDFVELSAMHVKSRPSEGGPSETVVKFQQTFAGLPIIGGKLNVEIVGGEVRAIHGKPHSRLNLDRAVGKALLAPRRSVEEAARVVEGACGQTVRPIDAKNPGPWIDPKAGSLVYRFLCGATIYHVDAATGVIAASGSARQHWTPTLVPILTGRDGNRVSDKNASWFPDDPMAPEVTMTRQSKVRVDRAPFASNMCSWSMSTYYDGESAQPFPSLRPGGDSPRGGIDLCSSPVIFTNTSNDKLKEQHAYDRIWLAAWNVKYATGAKFWAFSPPDEVQALRVNTWRSDSTGEHCGGHPASYLTLVEDIDLCLDNPRYQAYLTPLHEYGHYIADSYGFSSSDPYSPCDQTATREGVATTLAVLFEHYRYTGGAETMSATDRTILFGNGPGAAVGAIGTDKADLVDVDSSCRNPYDAGQAIVQVMWKLINNSLCQFDASGACTTVVPIGPSALPAWVREDFTRTLDLTVDDDTNVENFLISFYTRFVSARGPSFTSQQQLALLREAFTQNGVDLLF